MLDSAKLALRILPHLALTRLVRCAQPACIVPLVVALWVSASRIHDYAHSAGDVTGGLILGGAFGALMLARTRALDAQLHAEATQRCD